MTRFFMLLIGFTLSIIGFAFIISYLNLFSLGYNFFEYVHFTIRKIECLIGPIGILIICLTLTRRKKK